jgi:hypothetical protein
MPARFDAHSSIYSVSYVFPGSMNIPGQEPVIESNLADGLYSEH